jgi:hypothetical protein
MDRGSLVWMPAILLDRDSCTRPVARHSVQYLHSQACIRRRT